MKNAGKARSYGLYRHLRTSKEIIENLLNYSVKNTIPVFPSETIEKIIDESRKKHYNI